MLDSVVACIMQNLKAVHLSLCLNLLFLMLKSEQQLKENVIRHILVCV